MVKKTSSNLKSIKSLVRHIETTTKRLNKSNKKQDLEHIRNIKTTELTLLVLEMKDRMNSALFKKLTNPTRKPQIKMLNENIDTLKQLQKNDDKINVKSFNLKKKNIKIENSTRYTVFIKLEIISEENVSLLNEKAKNKLSKYHTSNVDIVEAGKFWQEMTELYPRIYSSRDINQTIKVTGKQNIQHKLKELIYTQLNYGYVIFVNVLQVHVNKQIMDEEEYRYLGGEIVKDHLRYFKAWNHMAFDYKGFNLDLNNETPFQCVPNALFKLYGNKEIKDWNYDAKIANGGIEYIKSNIEENDDDEEDYETEELRLNGFAGYTPDQIVKFCSRHKIQCFGFNWKLEQFITNKYDNIKFRHDLPNFVFYMNDSHIYIIDDKKMRQSLLKSNDNSEFLSVLAKEREKEKKEMIDNRKNVPEDILEAISNMTKQDNLVDIPFEEWDKHENKKIYITKDRVIHNKFYELITKGEVYNKLVKLSETDGVVRFQYKNKNTIIYNPDYYHVVKSIENLNKIFGKLTYSFENQKLNTLAMEILTNHYGGVKSSTFNNLGNEIFHSDFVKNTQFNGWFSEPKNLDELSSFDYNKHYTSCLMGQNIKFGWPVYNIFDEVTKFDGTIETGFYFVETNKFFPFRYNGWYDADLVYYGVESGIISKDNIKYQYKPSQEMEPKYFKKFIKFVYKHFDNPKLAINKMIGCFGHDYKNKNIHHFTTDGRNVFMEMITNPEAKVKYIYHDEFSKSKEIINIKTLDIEKCIRSDKPLCYHVYNDKRVHIFNNYLPLFYKVYNVSAMKMHQMSSLIGGKIRGVFTDTIIFEGKINKPNCDDKTIGGIRESTLKPFTKLMNIYERKELFTLPTIKFNKLNNFSIEDNKSVFITGDAGTGKSYLTNQLKSKLKENEFVSCTPTHKSALIIDGKTIYDVFNINPHDHTYLKSKVEKLKNNGLKWVFIDEISMINSKCWAVIRDIKRIYKFNFVLVGDFNQLPPVEDITPDIVNSSAFHEICDGNIYMLTKNWRADSCPDFKNFIDDLNNVKKGHDIDLSNYRKKECRKSIAWTNMTRKIINNEWMLKESKGKECYFINGCKVFVSLPIIANETRNVNKEYQIFNNEEFEVTFVDKSKVTIKNNRITIDIKHSEFKFFDLAYCITVHKCQGSTFDFPFTIYDFNFKGFDSKLLYTAMSRATKKEYINFCHKTYTTKKGYVYKITNEETNKIYIGSTTTSLDQRFKEHKESQDGSPLHNDMKLYDNWKIDLIKEIDFVDIEQLLILETCYIMSYDSITNGYNTKLSVKYENIY